ncbi:MAG TPA: hypothetical protein DFR83_07560 [Deltaproteobacteria bacterium]|nr:hypothetical protein [Deltaproteobacteria bacterium]
MSKFHAPICVSLSDLPDEICDLASRYKECELHMAVYIEHGHPEVATEMWAAFPEDLQEETLQRAVMRLAIVPQDSESRRLTLLFFDTMGVDLRF